MNNEHSELLDDLIDYYDSKDGEAGGNTTVVNIPKTAAVPADEALGDTMVVNTKPQPTARRTEETTTLNVSAPEPEIPEDEILGFTQINRPAAKTTEIIPEIKKPVDIPLTRKSDHTDYEPSNKRGLWYTLKPLWATIIVTAMLVASYFFYVTDTGIIGTYKSNFTYNLSLIMRIFGIEYNPIQDLPVISDNNPFVITAHAKGDSGYNNIKEKVAVIPFEGADSAKFEKYKNGVVCAKSNYLCFIDKKGEKKWELKTQISNPILSASGKYIAVAGKDNTYLDLYKDKKLLYSIKSTNKIKTCSVSEKGDVALVTDKTAYKGAVTVYNKNGEEVFSWISGVNYITSATMLKSRNVAVSLVSTDNTVKSYVMMFDIFKPDPINGSELPGSLIFDSASYKKDAYICADNAIVSVNSDGELEYNIKFNELNITHTASDTNGWRIVSYTDNYLPFVNVYNNKGDFEFSAATESTPDYIDLYKSIILYNNGRDIVCGKTDKTKTKYTAPMAVKNLVMMNKNTYLVAYENSVEIIKI